MSKRDVIASALEADLKAGVYRPGQRLPPEHELVNRYEASRETVRKALIMLAAKGLVTSIRTRGWFAQSDERLEFHFLTVDDNRHTANSDVWNTWVATFGQEGGSLLTVTREEPSPAIAGLLELEPGEECMVRSRVRLAGGDKWMLSTAYWPCWLTDGDPQMSREGRGLEVDMQNPSPLAWARQNGYPESVVVHEFDARMPDRYEMEELGIGTNAPVLLTYTTSRAPSGRPFRCTADVFPRHRFRLMAEHKRTET